MNIFDINNNILTLSEMIDAMEENGETENKQALIDTLDALEASLDDKLNGIGWLIAQTEVEINAHEKQEQRFKTKKQKAKNKVERLKELVSNLLALQNKEKFKTADFCYSFRKSTVTIIDDVEKVPKEFIKTTIKETADKTEIKKYLKEHKDETINWARLEERKSLQIK